MASPVCSASNAPSASGLARQMNKSAFANACVAAATSTPHEPRALPDAKPRNRKPTSSTVESTSRRLRLRCESIRKDAINDGAAAIPSQSPCGVIRKGEDRAATYSSPNAPISITARIKPRTSAGTSSAKRNNQKESGNAANLTQMLVSSNARAQSTSPRCATTSLATNDDAETAIIATYSHLPDLVRALCQTSGMVS